MLGPFSRISEEDSTRTRFPVNSRRVRTLSEVQVDLHKRIKEQTNPTVLHQAEPTLVINRKMTNVHSAILTIV